MTGKSEATTPIVTTRIARQILVVRGHKVMIDADLTALYGVTTKRFNEQVKRNLAHFPADFMFRLRDTEHSALRSQIATSIEGRCGRRYPPAHRPARPAKKRCIGFVQSDLGLGGRLNREL